MVTSKRRLLKAVRLLDEIIEDLYRSTLSGDNQGSSRALLVRLKPLRGLLATELEQSEPNWRAVVAPLLREAARWLVELGINNFQYIFSSLVQRACRLDRATWLCSEVLQA